MFATLDGIETRYELVGSGPPLLMFSPGGFNATLDNWSAQGVYRRTRPVDHLAEHRTCILFDRRESGRSGGRVEQVTWSDYVRQGKALLDHLGIERAALMGGCQGCSPVLAFAVAYPSVVERMVLYWPAGGPRYRMSTQERFVRHIAFVHDEGLAAVAKLARESGATFNADPRVGPWGSVLARDEAFADAFARQDPAGYRTLVAGMARTLVDRDTVAGAEPEQLLRLDVPALIVPGRDRSHATSGARYLQECLERADYWDVTPDEQTEDAVARRLADFATAP